MPTTPRKARILLNSGKAIKIHGKLRFTIQLVHGSSGYVQPADLGIDSGYSNVGFSAVNEQEELIGGELNLLEGMSQRLEEKAMYRRQRRQRIRHRQPKGKDHKKPEDWFAPSIVHKLESHQKLIDRVKEITPIRNVRVEVASFDTQKLKNPDIQGEEYQQGEKYGFDNLREYILHRDSHKCQNPDCKNKAKQPILQVHHLGFWKGDRTDRPANLITLCTKCHISKNHKPGGILYGWEPKLPNFKPETFMSIVWRKLAFEMGAEFTFGYITKAIRREFEIEKSHHNDAFVIAGGTTQQRSDTLNLEQIRRHNRSLERFYDAQYIDIRDGEKKSGSQLHSGRRTRNKNLNGENLRQYRGRKVSQGKRSIKTKQYSLSPKDLVLLDGRVRIVQGMQNNGSRVALKPLVGETNPKTGKLIKQKTAAIKTVIPLLRRGGICAAS